MGSCVCQEDPHMSNQCFRVPVKLNTSGNKAGAVKQAGLSMLKSTMSSPGNGNTQDEMKSQYTEECTDSSFEIRYSESCQS